MARKTEDVTSDAKTVRLSAATRRARQRMVDDGGTPSLRGTIIKIILLGIADAAAFFVSMLLVAKHQWTYLAGVVIVTLILNFIYLRRGGLPAKYLSPGVLFLSSSLSLLLFIQRSSPLPTTVASTTALKKTPSPQSNSAPWLPTPMRHGWT